MAHKRIGSIIVFFCLAVMHVFAVEESEQLDNFKKDAYLHYVRGLILEKEGKDEEALQEYQETLKLDPQASYVIQTMSKLNLRAGNLDAALQAAQRMQKIEPSNTDTYFLTGSIYLVQGKDKEAEESFTRILELDPSHKDALLHLAGLLADKKPKKAIMYLERFIEIEPQSPDIHYEIGLLLSREKSGYQKAVKHLEQAIEQDPEFFNACLALGQLHEQNKKFPESLLAYEKCLALNPDNKLLQAHMGLLYLQVGETKKAEELYQRMVAGGEEDMSLLFWLSLIAEEKKDWPKAVEYITRSLKQKKDSESLMRLSYYYVQMGMRKKAMEILKEVKKVDPKNTDVRLFLAYGYQEQGHNDKAIEELESALVQDPDMIAAHFQLGILYEQSGRFQKGIKHFYRVLELKNDHAAAANYLGYSFADRNIQLTEAEKLVRRALGVEPENPAYIDSLGWIFYRQGKYAEALAELSKASQKADDPIIKDHLGDARWAIAVLSEGKAATENAFESWEKSLAGDASNKLLKKKIRQNKTYGTDIVAKIKEKGSLFIANQEGIQDVGCFLSIKGTYKKTRFAAQGILTFKNPSDIRIDLLGPMASIICTIRYNDSGFTVNPENALDTLLDKSSFFAEEISSFIIAYFTGSIMQPLAHPGVVMDKTWGTYQLYDKPGRAVLRKKDGMMHSYQYFSEFGEKVEVRFNGFKDIQGRMIPSHMEFSVPTQHLNIHIKLDKIKINQSKPTSP